MRHLILIAMMLVGLFSVAQEPQHSKDRWKDTVLKKPVALSHLDHPDDPDFKREQAFFEVYKKYNQDPTPIENWDQVAKPGGVHSYKVQGGDTLWDLSSTLFGDPQFWPKIWALNNDQVLNPHEIETWMQIRFFPGDMNEAPAVSVAEHPTASTVAQAPTEKGPEASDTGLIPPPKKRAPILKQVPNSLPFYRYEEVNIPPLDFERYFPTPKQVKHEMPLAYYIADHFEKGVGKVEETEAGGKTASEFQFVFVSVQDPNQKVYTVIQDEGLVPDVREGSLKKGTLISVQGEIELIEPVSDRGIYRAIVRRSLTHIEVGAVLVPGKIQQVSTADGPVAKENSVNLMIIGAQYASRRNLVDAGGFVFLNGGTGQGVAVGQLLPIYSNQRLRNPDTKAVINDRLVGNIRIVHTAEHFSTGFVTRVWDDVFVGDATFNSAGKVKRGSVGADEMADQWRGLGDPTAVPPGTAESVEDPEAGLGAESNFMDEEPHENQDNFSSPEPTPEGDAEGPVDEDGLSL